MNSSLCPPGSGREERPAPPVRSCLAWLLALLTTTVAITASRAEAASAYVNPMEGDQYLTGRTDMGVDFCLTPGAPIRAVGARMVIGVTPNWFKHQPYVWYRLTSGRYAGRYVYVAEQTTRLARPGAHLWPGQPVAFYKRSGTCIEMGRSAYSGSTLAHITTGYHEGQVTRAGISFAYFLMSLGVQGPFELAPGQRHSHNGLTNVFGGSSAAPRPSGAS